MGVALRAAMVGCEGWESIGLHALRGEGGLDCLLVRGAVGCEQGMHLGLFSQARVEFRLRQTQRRQPDQSEL